MKRKAGMTSTLPPFLFPGQGRTERARIERLKRSGAIRKVAPRLYTSVPDSQLPETVRSLWSLIVSTLYPMALLSQRTALTFLPSPSGEIFLTAGDNRTLELPGLTVRFMKGPKPDEMDADFLSMKVSCLPRALLENLASAKGSLKNRKLSAEELEERLEKELTTKGEAHLNQMRDQAKTISERMGFEAEYVKLDQIIGALLSTRSHQKLESKAGIARSQGRPFDQSCLERLSLLATSLLSGPLPEHKNFPASAHFANKAFFEAYFSNYIEGTRFDIDEAERIVFEREISESRPLDAHDVLGTFSVVGDPTEMMKVPSNPRDLQDLLKSRHSILFRERPDIGPGIYKKEKNRAGNTLFVVPDSVTGTFEQGFELYRSLPPGLARAIFIMFLVSDVHPFNDGNGRVSRIMMNAELYSQGLSTIIIPNVYRVDYLGALKALSQRKNPGIYVRMLIKANEFSNLDFSNYSEIKQKITANFWFEDSLEIKIKHP